ncbi:MAG: phage holin family protein [Bacteroidetes bacterium]|jgi:putative membrane protein|nr:phage holin family protein [Bacteroidota bacterium]
MNFIIKLLVTAAVAFGLTYFLSGVRFDDFKTACIFAVVLSVLNVFVKPIFKIIGFPITIITLGFFSLVINTIITLIADYFVDGMHIDGFWWAFIFSIALSFFSSIFASIFTSSEEKN